MDTKECIEFLGTARSSESDVMDTEEFYKKMKVVIKRLQMWEDLKRDIESGKYYNILDYRDSKGDSLLLKLKKLEEKYFPKLEIRKEIKVEVLAENEDVIDELAKDIENMNGRIFDKGKIRIVTTRWERY